MNGFDGRPAERRPVSDLLGGKVRDAVPFAAYLFYRWAEHPARAAVEQNAIQVLLTDHHYWGGLHQPREPAAVCEVFGIELSMHSNSHLVIGPAAIPNLAHSCDTHYPWNSADDVIVPGVIEVPDGAVKVPTGPGLGVEPLATVRKGEAGAGGRTESRRLNSRPCCVLKAGPGSRVEVPSG